MDAIEPEKLSVMAARPGLPSEVADALSDAACIITSLHAQLSEARLQSLADAGQAAEALDRARAEGREAGLREAAEIAAARWGSLGGAADAISSAILALIPAEKEPNHAE